MWAFFLPKKGGPVVATSAVPGLLNTKEKRRFHLLLSKRWHLLPPFLSNEPGTGLVRQKKRGKKMPPF
jgi:hypothetical protein